MCYNEVCYKVTVLYLVCEAEVDISQYHTPSSTNIIDDML